MNLKQKIGCRIKELRKAKKLSQEKLSEMTDIAQNTLSYIETGDNFFTADTLEKLSAALEVEPQEIFDFEHFKDDKALLAEIITLLNQNPEKIPEIYRIIKAIIV